MELVLPWTVAHEVAHHLRHHYGAPIGSHFVEEQVVNCIAIALLGEHPRYRERLPALQRWADRVFNQTRPLSPETAPYLAGFRLDAGEVLVAQGAIGRATLVEARRLAAVTDSTAEEMLRRTGGVAAAQLDRALAERTNAEAYFNSRYMASLGEYWLFGAEWLARYLERDDLPSLGDALGRYLLTRDWEASRHEATRLLLEQALRGTDPAIAAAAAEAIAEHDGAAGAEAPATENSEVGDAAALAARRKAPDAIRRLDEVALSLTARARRLARIEAQSAAHPGLELLTHALGEERWRLARLGVRAVGEAIDPGALDLVERALGSPDPTHREGGRAMVAGAFGVRGRQLARLLEPGAPAARPGSASGVVVACAAVEVVVVRALAAFVAPRVLAPAPAQTLLVRLAADRDGCVRSEAERALSRLTPPAEGTMLTTIEKLMFLRAVPAFASCELDTLRRIAETVVAQQFAAGEVVVREGEPGRDMYVVTAGRVGVSAGGRTIDDLGPRQYFGEMALFDGGPRSATATALEATTLLRIDRNEFYQLGRQAPELLVGVIQVLSERLRVAMARTSEETTAT